MDETLIRRAAAALAAALAAGLLCGAAASAHAAAGAELQDPTRPPAVLAPAPAAAAPSEAAPMLQSVQVGKAADGARGRSAVINGESVRVGERFRGARVIRIADNEVELQRGRAHQVLRLYAAPLEGGMVRVKGEK